METPIGNILSVKNIKDFTEINDLSENQYLLAISNNTIGEGAKIKSTNFNNNLISLNNNNTLVRGTDNKLYVGAALTLYDVNYNYSEGQFAIDNTKIYKSLVDENLGNPTSDTDYWQEIPLGVNFSNKSQITNCILEAPNGVAEYSGSTITVKQGLKVLIPNGRNADGTLNNIEYTLSQDITGTIVSSLKDYRYVFIGDDGIFRHWRNQDIYFTKERPTRDTQINQVWFDIENNYWYWANTGSSDWVIIKVTPVAFFYWDTTTISQFNEIKSINLLKQSDKSGISGWGMPSNRYIDLSLGVNGSTYVAPANGWFTIFKEAGNPGHKPYLALKNTSAGYLTFETRPGENGSAFMRISIPAKKGDVIQIDYDAIGITRSFRFIYAEGEV